MTYGRFTVVLRSFMQPGTVHFVISTEDCLAIGGHFYSPGTLDRTLMCMVFERYTAPNITNTAHTKCGALFMRMLCYLHVAIGSGTEEDAVWFPNDRELAHMIVITAYLDQLVPLDHEDPSENPPLDSEDDDLPIPATRKPKETSKPEDPSILDISLEGIATFHPDRIPEVWQKTEEFLHDFNFVSNDVIPELVTAAVAHMPGLIREIVEAENTLLKYGKAFDDQMPDEKSEEDPLPFVRSSVLRNLYEDSEETDVDGDPYDCISDSDYTFPVTEDEEYISDGCEGEEEGGGHEHEVEGDNDDEVVEDGDEEE